MSMLYRSKLFRNNLKAGILFAAMAFSLAQEALAVTPTPTVAPLILSGRQNARPVGTFSSGISEIIKMLDAKVDAQIILAYIQNSSTPYNPDATELIALKDHGAPTEMLTALLHHGDELRLRMAQAQSAVNPSPAAPVNDFGPETAALAYPSGYADSSSAPYPATYYGDTCGWPLVYWPSVYVAGYRPYWYAYGRNGYGHHPGEGARRNWANVAPLAPQTRAVVSAPSSAHASFAAMPSGGSRGFSHSGGRSGGRSR